MWEIFGVRLAELTFGEKKRRRRGYDILSIILRQLNTFLPRSVGKFDSDTLLRGYGVVPH